MRDEASHCTAQMFTVQRIGEFKTYIIELFDHIARSRLDGPAAQRFKY